MVLIDRAFLSDISRCTCGSDGYTGVDLAKAIKLTSVIKKLRTNSLEKSWFLTCEDIVESAGGPSKLFVRGYSGD
jgi:hypothetical protein